MINLTSPFTLIKQAFKIYCREGNFWYIVKIVLASALLGIIVVLVWLPLYLFSGLTGVLTGQVSQLPFVLIVIGLLFLIVSVFFGSWLQVATLQAVIQIEKGEIIGVRQTFSLAWKKVFRYFLANFLFGVMIIFGLILLVIPGIIFAIWFSFYRYLIVAEDARVIGSIRKSKFLVSGYFLPILGRNVIFVALSLMIIGILNLIPFVGSLLFIFLAPYFSLLSYLLYQDVKAVKEAEARI